MCPCCSFMDFSWYHPISWPMKNPWLSCEYWNIHAPWKSPRQVHGLFMAFLRPMKKLMLLGFKSFNGFSLSKGHCIGCQLASSKRKLQFKQYDFKNLPFADLYIAIGSLVTKMIHVHQSSIHITFIAPF